MRLFLQIIGYIWAIIGVGNIVSMPWAIGATGLLTFGLLFNMLLFIFPGIIVANIIQRKDFSVESSGEDSDEGDYEYSQEDIEQQLEVLEQLYNNGKITEDERKSARLKVLST